MQFLSFHGGHTTYSDGEGTPEDYVKRALALGFTSYGFSEHLPRPEKYRYPKEIGKPVRGLATFLEYRQEILKLKKKYEGKIEILYGVEIDYFPDQEDYIRDYLKRYEFDYCIGSVHFVRGLPIDCGKEHLEKVIKELGSLSNVYIEYYKTIQKMLTMECFDIVGHLDVIKKYNEGCDDPKVWKTILETLEIIKKYGAVLDVNTAEYDKPCKELYPSKIILKEAYKLDIDVTLGDDSHAPEQIGRHFDRAIKELKSAGYKEIIKFSKKKNVLHKIYIKI